MSRSERVAMIQIEQLSKMTDAQVKEIVQWLRDKADTIEAIEDRTKYASPARWSLEK